MIIESLAGYSSLGVLQALVTGRVRFRKLLMLAGFAVLVELNELFVVLHDRRS